MKVVGRDMNVERSRGEIVPRDFAAAVKDIKLAILQSRARAAHASNVELPQMSEIRHLSSDEMSFRFFALVIEGVRRERANGLKERTKKKGRQ